MTISRCSLPRGLALLSLTACAGHGVDGLQPVATCARSEATLLAVTKAPDFDQRIVAPDNDLGYVRVRSSASFSASDLGNVLAHLAVGEPIAASGPRKNMRGIFYTVVVTDTEGERCLGFVSGQVVRIAPE